MKFVKEIPQSDAEKTKKRKSLEARRKAHSAFCFIFALLAILCLVGTLITLFMAELGNHAAATKTLLYILSGSFLGGAIAAAFLGVLLSKIAQNALSRELDYLERCDGENSFFVGEGTLATFGNGAVLLHGAEGGKTVKVPYEKMRFFSVCTRHKPKETGEWSVVMEIPESYLSKSGKGEEKALIQTDAKERLYDCLEREGLELLGELPPHEPVKKKFSRIQAFSRPDRKKRNRALILIVISALLCAGGIPAAIFWEVTAGSFLCVIGAFLLGRSVYAFCKAQSALIVYKEGLWWNDHGAVSDSIFLKWEEIESVNTEESGDVTVLNVRCAYGAYRFPAIEGAEKAVLSAKECAKEQEK